MAFNHATSSPSSLRGSLELDNQESPASFSYHNNSFEYQGMMETIDGKEDISGVMTKVLAHLDRIVEHLRDHGETDAANHIAKGAIAMVTTLNDATAPWDIQKCLLKPVPQRPLNPVRAINDEQISVKQMNSWAAVAATATDENNRLVKFRPTDGLKRMVTEEEQTVNLDDENLRVLWIQNWEKDRPLRHITEHISHGALYSIAYAEQLRAVCVIFQQTSSARAVLREDAHAHQIRGQGLFGGDRVVVAGLPYPENEDIRRMQHPHSERRRLTFARQQLFAGDMTEAQFKQDIYAIVGEANVELVWLFNTGNATVVFTGCMVARTVRDEFRRLARSAGPYRDIQVTYSHDPCERALHLITQMAPNGARSSRGFSMSHGTTAAPTTVYKNGNGAPSGKAIATGPKRGPDAEGWQTVGRRR